MANQVTSFPELTTTERNALTSVPTNTVILNTDNNQFELWTGLVWSPLVGAGQSGAFAAFASSQVVTDSTSITSGSFLTFSNSPAFTFIPSVTGVYKVYCPISLDAQGTNAEGNGRIFNTSGGATLLQESQSTSGGGGPFAISSGIAQSTYALTAGTTYVFDIQGKVVGGSDVIAAGLECPFYMFAEGISLQGTLNTTGSSYNIFTSSQVSTISSPVSGIAPSFTTFDNSPALTFKPAVSGTYKVYASVPLEINSSAAEAVCRIINTSGAATLLSESQGVAYSDSPATVNSATAQSVYELTANVTYIFNIQGATTGAGSAFVRGDVAPFYMYAEGIGLNNNAQQFPVTFKAVYNVNGTNYGSGANIYCNTVLFDSNSAYNTSTGVYTCPYDGYYSVGLMAQSANTADFYSYIQVNGTTPNGSPQPAYLNDWPAADQISSDSTIIHMKKGDLLTWVQGNSAPTNFMTVWVNSVSLDQGLTGPRGRSTGSAFAYFASSAITTNSADITTNIWQNFTNSPAFTFTPTISGIYKVYCPLQISTDGSTDGLARIFNTSGGATLLQESQAQAGSSVGFDSSCFIQSVYALTAGTTYVFDIQGNSLAGGITALGNASSVYMFAEGIGLTGSFSDSTTPWNTNLSLTPNGAFGSFTGLVTQSRVVGDTLEVNVFLTAGASLPSTTMALALPTGYVIDASKLSANGAALDGWANSQYSGANIDINTAEYLTYPFFDGSDVNNIYFASQTGGGIFAKAVSNSYLEASIPWQATFKVPIVGLFGTGKTGVSRIVKSNSTGAYTQPNGGPNPVLDNGGVNPVTVTVQCDGGDVEVGFMADGVAVGAAFTDQSPTDSGMYVDFLRDGIVVHSQFMYMQNNVTIEIHYIPSNSFRFIDTPTPGSHTYTVQTTLSNSNRGSSGFQNSVLYARPLA